MPHATCACVPQVLVHYVCMLVSLRMTSRMLHIVIACAVWLCKQVGLDRRHRNVHAAQQHNTLQCNEEQSITPVQTRVKCTSAHHTTSTHFTPCEPHVCIVRAPCVHHTMCAQCAMRAPHRACITPWVQHTMRAAHHACITPRVHHTMRAAHHACITPCMHHSMRASHRACITPCVHHDRTRAGCTLHDQPFDTVHPLRTLPSSSIHSPLSTAHHAHVCKSKWQH